MDVSVFGMIVVLGSGLVGAAYSIWLGWCYAKTILSMEYDYPAWLESLLPLKGRWLGLLLTTPLLLLVMVTAFGLVTGALCLLGLTLVAFFYLHLGAGLLAVGSLTWLVLWIWNCHTNALQEQRAVPVSPGTSGE
jgi:hypothetical protein